MGLATDLADHPGLYAGTGDGPESGPFAARIAVAVLPNGGVSVDYEARSADRGVLHREHSLLVAGPGGRDHLYIAHSESPFVTEMVADMDGEMDGEPGRFVQLQPSGPYAMSVVVGRPAADRLTWAWWWAEAGHPPVEQSKADVRREGDER